MTTQATNDDEGCCPPGSHGAPVNVGLAEDQKGVRLTLGPTQTPCYYTAPADPSSKLGMVLFHDVWGLQSRLPSIADWLAQEGNYHVIVADTFRGETKDDHPDIFPWLKEIPYDPVVAQDTQTCRDYLTQEKNVTAMGAMGFCWGGWAIAKTIEAGMSWKVAVSPHPSFVAEKLFDGDDVALMQKINCPLLLLPAGNDPPYTKPDSSEFQVLQKAHGSKSVEFPDMVHGWTTRGDLGDKTLKRDVDGALAETIQFLKLHHH